MNTKKIAVIGQGYVGLPLAIEFGKKYRTLGFDINAARIAELERGEDHTKEADLVAMKEATDLYKNNTGIGLSFACYPEKLKDFNVFIVSVPTPIDEFNNPDLTPLIKASAMLGNVLKKGDIVIYESTVYPGCTEEDCVPVLEKYSGLKFNEDFYCGYSPERINPGDKINTLTTIKKITSGSTPEIANVVDDLYNSILKNGTHRAPNMKVAEAAKVIENTQRDINISFMNELALIFDRVGIDTNDVIEAAGSKWNFLKYRPGLVGGHCISVDPYYLAHKANALGYHPQVILSGRRVNNSIANFIAQKTMKLMIQADHKIKNANILLLGITFKEDCPDMRNSKVIDIYNELKEYGITATVADPAAASAEAKQLYGMEFVDISTIKDCDAVILAVAHDEFKSLNQADFDKMFKSEDNSKRVLADIKGLLDRKEYEGLGYNYWRL